MNTAKKTQAAVKPGYFVVKLGFESRHNIIAVVMAMSSCDAVVKAMELSFDEDSVVPSSGLTICARPISFTPMAA